MHEFENKKIFRGTFIMLLQKCLYTAFPLVTMEKLFMLLSKAYSSLCRLFSSYSRTLLQHLSLFPTSSVFHLFWNSLSTLKKKNHCLDSTHPTNILPPFSPFLAKLGEWVVSTPSSSFPVLLSLIRSGFVSSPLHQNSHCQEWLSHCLHQWSISCPYVTWIASSI